MSYILTHYLFPLLGTDYKEISKLFVTAGSPFTGNPYTFYYDWGTHTTRDGRLWGQPAQGRPVRVLSCFKIII